MDIFLLQSLFVARADAYAVQVDAANGGGYRCLCNPLTGEVLSSHLNGTITIALYPFKESVTKWLVFDLDEDDCWDLIQIKNVLARHEVPSYLEDSGRFWHLWCFFAKPVNNCIARALASHVIKEADCQNTIEVYPKQNVITGVGSCIKLPLGINRKSEKRSCFVDDGKVPVKDSAAFLQAVERVPESSIREILEVNDIVLPLAPASETVLSVDTLQPPASITTPPPKFNEPCINDYWTNGAPEGRRGWADYQLGIRFKEMGLSVESALAELKIWRARCAPGKSPFTEVELENQVRNAYSKGQEKACCIHAFLKEMCIGTQVCPVSKNPGKGKVKQYHNNALYLLCGWQNILSAGDLLMVGFVLPFLEKKKGVHPGEELLTFTEELEKWSGLSEPGRTLTRLKESGLIEYIPGIRGGGKVRRPTIIRRITPVPRPLLPKKENAL